VEVYTGGETVAVAEALDWYTVSVFVIVELDVIVLYEMEELAAGAGAAEPGIIEVEAVEAGAVEAGGASVGESSVGGALV
jgi:hypothetical protein